MIISFKYKQQKESLKIDDIYDVVIEKNENNRILSFPLEGMDLNFNWETEEYKVYFDTEKEFNSNHISSKIINEVKRIYLRRKKIEKINETNIF